MLLYEKAILLSEILRSFIKLAGSKHQFADTVVFNISSWISSNLKIIAYNLRIKTKSFETIFWHCETMVSYCQIYFQILVVGNTEHSKLLKFSSFINFFF
jgi:hypothetical protein